MVLKLSKSNINIDIGFTSVEFFGYKISKDHYELTEERKKVVNDIPYPTNVKHFLAQRSTSTSTR